jgi:hypothetical protein
LYVFRFSVAQCFDIWLKFRATLSSARTCLTLAVTARAHLNLPPAARCGEGNAHMWFLCCLTFDMSGPEPAWPMQRNMNLRSRVGQAGGGPLDGRVRQHCVLPLSASSVGLNGRGTQGSFEHTRRCFRPVCSSLARAPRTRSSNRAAEANVNSEWRAARRMTGGPSRPSRTALREQRAQALVRVRALGCTVLDVWLKFRATPPSARTRFSFAVTARAHLNLPPAARCREGNAHTFLCCLTFDMRGGRRIGPRSGTIT